MTTDTSQGPAVLSVRGAEKSYGAVRALRGVDLDVRSGEILGLVGANGAGKSTLIGVLTGVVQPDAGEVLVDGKVTSLRSMRDALDHGVAVVRQDVDLVADLTIAENLFLGCEAGFRRRGQLDRRQMGAASRPLLERVGLETSPSRKLRTLAIGDQQLVAAARALHRAGRVLLLDEPTSSLSPWESARLFEALRAVAAQGVGIVYISHRLQEVAELCDRSIVLRDGAVVAEFGDVRANLDGIVSAMTPDTPDSSDNSGMGTASREVALRVADIRVGRHGPASFTVHRGEVVGIFGLVGAGRSTMGRAIAGVLRPDSGAIIIDGEACRLASPWHGFRAGIAYCSEQRKTESILPSMSVASNLVVRAPPGTSRWGFLRPRGVRRHALNMIERLTIATPSETKAIEQLSGGNQQKVVLGRLLAEDLRVLVLDEPTHGIDVKAKRELIEMLRDLARGGLAVVFISSELTEIMTASDRVLVMRRGVVTAEFAPGASERELVGAAAGHLDTPREETNP
ncbi:L-arabinose ABC transporter ATP-binding protein AraG [soil metagenome]